MYLLSVQIVSYLSKRELSLIIFHLFLQIFWGSFMFYSLLYPRVTAEKCYMFNKHLLIDFLKSTSDIFA